MRLHSLSFVLDVQGLQITYLQILSEIKGKGGRRNRAGMGGAHKFYFLPLPLPPPWEKEREEKEGGGALWNPLSLPFRINGRAPMSEEDSRVTGTRQRGIATGHHFSKKKSNFIRAFHIWGGGKATKENGGFSFLAKHNFLRQANCLLFCLFRPPPALWIICMPWNGKAF